MAQLTIKDWNLGIGESVYTGFGQMVNVDIYSKPGCLKISNRLEPDGDSAGTITELIKWMVQDPQNGDIYATDRNGTVYKRDNGSDTWTTIGGHGVANADGDGLAIWKDYLFYARGTRLDLYALPSSPNGDAGTWYNDWDATDSGSPYDLESDFGYDLHPILSSSQRFVLYIGNASYVDSLEQVAGQVFDPGDPTTWIYNDKDLELGSDYRVTCLEEQGTLLAIGTLVGINGIFNIADIFFWDGFSDLIQGGGTIHLVEDGVKMMKNVGNILYTIAGTGVPRVFQATTSQSIEAKRFNNISVPFAQKLSLRPGAIELKDGEILFGIGQGVSNNLPYMGVYSLRNNAYVLRNIISTGRDGSTNTLLIGCIKSVSANRILVSWKDDDDVDVYGVDVLTENFYTDYKAYVESPLYTVGTESDPKTYERIEVRMGKRLQSGDGIKIYVRTALDDSWTIVATFDTPTYTGRYNFESRVANMSRLIDFQVRVELTTDVDSEISPELKEIVFM